MDLESAKPKLRTGVTLHPHPEGGGVVRDWAHGVYLALDPDDFFVAGFLDGAHPTAEVNRALFARTGELRISSLIHLLARLQARELIEPLAVNLDAGAERVNPAERLLRKAVGFNLSWPRHGAPAGGKPGAPWAPIAAAALAGLALLTFEAPGSGHVLIWHDSHTLGVGLFFAALGLALSLRNLAAAWVLRSFGAGSWRTGLGLVLLIPHVWVDARDVALGGRRARLQLAAARLAVSLVLAGAAKWALAHHGGSALRIVDDAFLLVLFATTFPLLPGGDVQALLGAFERPEKMWARWRTRLHDHLTIKNTRNPFHNEPVLLLMAAAVPAWAGFAYAALEGLVHDNFIAMVSDVFLNGHPVLKAAVLLMLAAAAFTGALAAAVPVYEVLRAAGRLVPGWQRHLHARRVAPLREETWQALGDVALFAHLGEDALRELADRVQIESYEAGDRVFAQGDAGDRFYSVHRGQVEILWRDEQGFNKSVAVLGPGDSFGEIALLEGGPRTASVRALARTELFALSREPFDAFIKRLGLEGAEVTEFLRLSQFLRGIKLFRNLGPAETVRILQQARRRLVKAGEIIVQEGDEGAEFYLIRSGAFAVTVRGKEAARLKPGEYFGEIALLMRTRRTARVIAASDGELLVLGRDHFYDTVAANFQLGLGLEQVTRLRRAQSKALAAT
jgi:CRP-like cAMP-binding protein